MGRLIARPSEKRSENLGGIADIKVGLPTLEKW